MKDIKLFAKAVLFCMAFISATACSVAQQGYEIKIKVDGWDDTPVILGNFFGESTYIVDSSVVENGYHIFRGQERLAEGMYFVAKEKQRLFDFIVFRDQHFTLTTSSDDYITNMQVASDEDNELFVKDMLYNREKNNEAEPFLTILRDSTSSEEARSTAQDNLNELNTQVQNYRKSLIAKHPESFLALMYRAQQEDLPDEDAGLDKLAEYKANYWNDFDLSDPRLLRLNMPLYKDKVHEYLDRWAYQEPDSLVREIDALAAVAKKNQDTYKYFVWMVTLKYQNPKIMGQDKVFVHMNDTYFASGEMDFWANDQLKQNVAEYANQLRRSLIGEKAPNMIMMDENLQARSLYDVASRFTVVYFFDPDCYHCKLATPVLDELYDEKKYDMEVFAVSTDTSMVKMTDYIRDMELSWITVNGPRTATEPYYQLYDAMTTPTIYILNEEKEIIAKKLPVERVDEFLRDYLARKK
jgi:thiol-disulfide isomerase/thioredoxin